MEQNMHFNVGILVTITQVLLVGETRVPGENNRTATSYRQTLSDKIVSSTPRMSGIRTYNVNGDRH